MRCTDAFSQEILLYYYDGYTLISSNDISYNKICCLKLITLSAMQFNFFHPFESTEAIFWDLSSQFTYDVILAFDR